MAASLRDAGVESPECEIYKARSPVEPGSQYEVLAGLWVKLLHGLGAPFPGRPLCQRRPDCTPFHDHGVRMGGWTTVTKIRCRPIVSFCLFTLRVPSLRLRRRQRVVGRRVIR